jgi:hypothetical protein
VGKDNKKTFQPASKNRSSIKILLIEACCRIPFGPSQFRPYCPTTIAPVPKSAEANLCPKGLVRIQPGEELQHIFLLLSEFKKQKCNERN